MVHLKEERLLRLRDRLRAKGQRPSMLLSPGMDLKAKGAQDLIEAASIVEEWGAFVEAMYLMMAVDKRVLNVEREVLRGALHVLSDDRVRTTHMEAMLDAAARKIAEEGAEKRLAKVVEAIKDDRDRAELTIVLAAAVAAADAKVVPEEHELLTKLCKGLDIDEARANEILNELDDELAKRKSSP